MPFSGNLLSFSNLLFLPRVLNTSPLSELLLRDLDLLSVLLGKYPVPLRSGGGESLFVFPPTLCSIFPSGTFTCLGKNPNGKRGFEALLAVVDEELVPLLVPYIALVDSEPLGI